MSFHLHIMRYILSILILLFYTITVCGQTDYIVTDCNPKLNESEAQICNAIFKNESYDFRNKTIAFANNKIGDISYHRSLWSRPKKNFFELCDYGRNDQITYRLIIFSTELKKFTRGFDALIIGVDQKYNRRRIRKSRFNNLITSLSYRELNYPYNLDKVGTDNNTNLTNEEVIFFNRLYEHYEPQYDFKNKKVGFSTDKKAITKNEYINHVKTHLENDFLYPMDFIHVMSSQEKTESGGYDAVIIFFCKRYNMEAIIHDLKDREN